jgi:hypothetical protein
MQELLTSYLIQAKYCNLPGIGSFKVATTPAFIDVANKKLFPSSDEFVFSEKTDKISEEMIKYISAKKKIAEADAKAQIKDWCKNIKEKMASGETIVFESIGNIQKDAAGNIIFEKQKGLSFFEPVTAERVIHKNAEHAVLVGDRETTSAVMNHFLNEEEVVVEQSSGWRIMALALLLIALLILFFHLYTNSTSDKIGNQNGFPLNEPSPTYLLK